VRSVDYGEADRVVTVLTEDYGVRSLFAASARKSQRRSSGALQALRLIEVTYTDRNPERLARLTDAKVLSSFDAIATDLHKLYWTSLLLEWCSKIYPEGEEVPIFESAIALLDWLVKEKRGGWFVEIGCLRFALLMLTEAGFMPSIHGCFRSGARVEDVDSWYFSTDGGGLLSPDALRPEDRARPVSSETIELLRVIAQGRFPKTREVKVLRDAREIVCGLVRVHLDGEPRTMSLVRTVWL
jgi:DNA repair protein RecO (recombination protein O)